MKRKLLVVLSMVMTLSLFALAGCGGQEDNNAENNGGNNAVDNQVVSDVLTDGQTVGEGAISCTLNIVNKAGESINVTLKTDAENVGAALVDNKIASGENGAYGLMLDTVNGEKLVFEEDGYYWAFYVNGDYAAKGVSETPVEEGVTYALKAQK